MKRSLCVGYRSVGILMAFWFKAKKRQPEFREYTLPGDMGTVSLPTSFTVEMEDNSTLLAYPDDCDLGLRVSSISFAKKGSDEEVAKAYVQEKAAEKGYAFTDMDEKGVAAYQKEADEDGVPLLIKYWEVGAKNTIVIVSATLRKADQRNANLEHALDIVPQIIDSMRITKTHQILAAEGKEIQSTVEAVDAMPQDVRPLSVEESTWLSQSEDRARELSLKYGSGAQLDPEELDCIFVRWMAASGEKESAEDVANALGAAFGKYLVDELGFQWVVVTDEYGTEYAVRHHVDDTMSFPRSSVEKRIEDGQSDEFFDSLYLVIKDHVESPGE